MVDFIKRLLRQDYILQLEEENQRLMRLVYDMRHTMRHRKVFSECVPEDSLCSDLAHRVMRALGEDNPCE